MSLVFLKFIKKILTCHASDSLVEWSKVPNLGSGPKWRGFKFHNYQFYFLIYFFKQKMNSYTLFRVVYGH